MLSKEENELITRTGPGTPMGQAMRRYWIPACLSKEIAEPDCAPVRVKLLGEELVAFRDTEGRIGLFEEYCPHRRVSLYFGRNEECGLRCVYHGWKFDVTSACVDQLNEPEEHQFKHKVKLVAYPTCELGGIVWAYL
ncbi:MAG TPA: Rieske 2Fe-2S domain-containing protein, partial [Reyranella sp.]|nr:Rieske 2Fe-2S domain-containing protein [Reyranella sp.]